MRVSVPHTSSTIWWTSRRAEGPSVIALRNAPATGRVRLRTTLPLFLFPGVALAVRLCRHSISVRLAALLLPNEDTRQLTLEATG